MSSIKKTNFKMMSFIHETLYGLFRNPYKTLNAAGLEPNQRILEVGCGPGFFTIPAAKIVGEKGIVYAIDINPIAIEKVQQKIMIEKVTNVKTLQANAAQIDLPDQSFDLIFLFGLTRPIGNMKRIWIELHRLLASRGILSIEGRLRPPIELFKLEKRQRRISQYIKNVLSDNEYIKSLHESISSNAYTARSQEVLHISYFI